MSQYTDFQWWTVVYQYDPDTDTTSSPEPWEGEDGGPGGEYAQVTPLLQTAVNEATADSNYTLMGYVSDGFKSIGDQILQYVRDNFLSQIGNDPTQFMCVNAATIVAGYPAAAAVCLTGDGTIVVAVGLGVPSGEFIKGQTTDGSRAVDLLTGTSFSSSVGTDGILVGSMQSIPSGTLAAYSGFGISPSPLGISITYGFAIGNVNTGISPNDPFGHEGGG